MNDNELFMSLFKKLKNEINNSPNNLSWLSKEKPKLLTLSYELHEKYLLISKDMATKSSKHYYTPASFQKEWIEFESKYIKYVEESAKLKKDTIILKIAEALREGEQNCIESGKTKEEYWDSVNERIAKLKPTGSTFNPLVDNPALFMQSLYDFIHDAVNVAYFDDDIYDGALGAWSFYEKTIGVNFEQIYRRWKNSPDLFIPLSIQNTNTIPLIELYNEAVRAYTFGARIASVAMCRALMEHILTKYYKVKEENLKKIIAKAEIKFPELKRFKMDDKRRLGNDILHDYENSSEIADKAVVNFLVTIKDMVLKAASKNR